MSCQTTLRVVALLAVMLAWMSTREAQPAHAEQPAAKNLVWMTDYGQAMKAAEKKRKLLLIAFERDDAPLQQRFDQHVRSKHELRQIVERKFVLCKLPVSARIVVDTAEFILLEHPAFDEMVNRPGVAIIDLTDPDSKLYKYVVTVYPLNRGRQLGREHLSVLLNLPRGTLTQRSLIFAVRTHPERPASASGEYSVILAEESEQHSFHQASITLQGHHNWESRFHRINARLPDGLLAQEVCAESWPGQSLLDAAEDCVASWRQSSGHWSAVRSNQRFFGFDMKRGRNRIWYATGIFARRR